MTCRNTVKSRTQHIIAAIKWKNTKLLQELGELLKRYLLVLQPPEQNLKSLN